MLISFELQSFTIPANITYSAGGNDLKSIPLNSLSESQIDEYAQFMKDEIKRIWKMRQSTNK